jgi:hypothetical protein
MTDRLAFVDFGVVGAKDYEFDVESTLLLVKHSKVLLICVFFNVTLLSAHRDT